MEIATNWTTLYEILTERDEEIYVGSESNYNGASTMMLGLLTTLHSVTL